MEREGSRRGSVDSVGRRELPTLARLLALEREKRIGAERLVEAERQALLQLRSLLHARARSREKDYSSVGRKEPGVVSHSSVSRSVFQPASPPQRETKSSHSGDDLLATVYSQLPVEAQGLLGGKDGGRWRSKDLFILPLRASFAVTVTVVAKAMTSVQMNDSRHLEKLLAEGKETGLVREHGSILLHSAAEGGHTGKQTAGAN